MQSNPDTWDDEVEEAGVISKEEENAQRIAGAWKENPMIAAAATP